MNFTTEKGYTEAVSRGDEQAFEDTFSSSPKSTIFILSVNILKNALHLRCCLLADCLSQIKNGYLQA